MLPTHGFGSFCSATQASADRSTIGLEKAENPVLTRGEEEWVADLLEGLDVWPAYYAHMGPANSAGPGAPDLSSPEPADAATLRRRIEAGEWVVDLRNRVAFAAGHVPGTFNAGLDGQFATYLGWLIPWGTPLTLLGTTAEEVAEAQRELVQVLRKSDPQVQFNVVLFDSAPHPWKPRLVAAGKDDKEALPPVDILNPLPCSHLC